MEQACQPQDRLRSRLHARFGRHVSAGVSVLTKDGATTPESKKAACDSLDRQGLPKKVQQVQKLVITHTHTYICAAANNYSASKSHVKSAHGMPKPCEATGILKSDTQPSWWSDLNSEPLPP